MLRVSAKEEEKRLHTFSYLHLAPDLRGISADLAAAAVVEAAAAAAAAAAVTAAAAAGVGSFGTNLADGSLLVRPIFAAAAAAKLDWSSGCRCFRDGLGSLEEEVSGVDDSDNDDPSEHEEDEEDHTVVLSLCNGHSKTGEKEKEKEEEEALELLQDDDGQKNVGFGSGSG